MSHKLQWRINQNFNFFFFLGGEKQPKRKEKKNQNRRKKVLQCPVMQKQNLNRDQVTLMEEQATEPGTCFFQ